MKKTLVLILGVVTFFTTTFAQQFKINLTNLSQDKAALYSLSGEKTNFIDSISADQNSTFVYNAKGLSTIQNRKQLHRRR